MELTFYEYSSSRSMIGISSGDLTSATDYLKLNPRMAKKRKDNSFLCPLENRAWFKTFAFSPPSSLFEMVVKYFDAFLNLIPLSFVLGFYVSYVASRWWQQFLAIPWPDKYERSKINMPNQDLYVNDFLSDCFTR